MSESEMDPLPPALQIEPAVLERLNNLEARIKALEWKVFSPVAEHLIATPKETTP